MSKHGDRPPSSETAWKALAGTVRGFIQEFGLQKRETEDARLQITFLFDTTDPRAIAEQLSAVADDTGEAARQAAHYTELAREGRRFVGTAELTGGPHVQRLRQDCYHRFRKIVQQIVEQAGFRVLPEDAFQGVSERLRWEPDLFKVTTIEDAGAAVEWLCIHFADRSDAEIRDELAFAYAEEAKDAQATQGPKGAVAWDLLPLETKEQRRAAVKQKLASVSEDLDLYPPLTHDTDFWRVSPYTDPGAFQDWMKTGGPKSAADAFRAVLMRDSHDYYRRLQTWPERRQLAQQKKT
jgi:hypothetical protein